MYRIPTPEISSHRLTTLAMNSGPLLSERMKAGSPRTSNRVARVFMTSCGVMDLYTSNARHSLVYSSTTGIIFRVQPYSVRSRTKS
jgi:hypothetical protein